MYITHPQQSVNGLPPEDVFYAADAAGQPVGEGLLIRTYQPYLFPERPLNLYLSIRAGSGGAGADMLLGALLARAQQIREANPQMKARVFTQVDPQDQAQLALYMENGFDSTDAMDVVQVGMPAARPNAPMGYDMGAVPFRTPAERQAFLNRMNLYRMDAWQPAMLERYMSFPHFFALYLSRGPEVVGEIAFTGDGSSAKLLGMYISPNYRRLGLAKTLVAAGLKILGDKGVTHVEGDVIRRSPAQCALASACNCSYLRTACCYPGINYD